MNTVRIEKAISNFRAQMSVILGRQIFESKLLVDELIKSGYSKEHAMIVYDELQREFRSELANVSEHLWDI